MNIQQAMQAGPAKVNELFAKLAETSNGAAKTRETLFADLKAELEQVADLEEKHLFPLLAKHKETQDLVSDAKADSKALRAQLKELERTPKNEDAFLQAVMALRKGFQQHIRDGKKELLPAIQKALSSEEAQQVAENIEAGIQKAEQGRREEAAKARDEAKVEREREQRRAEAEAEAERMREAAEKNARQTEQHLRETARETIRQAAAIPKKVTEASETASRQITGLVAEGLRRSTASASESAEIYQGAAADAARDFQAVATVSTAAIRAFNEIQGLWGEHLTASFRNGANLSQRMMGCTSHREVAKLQRDFVSASMRNWIEGNARVLQITQRIVSEVLPTLQERLDAKPDGQGPGAG